MSEKTKNHDLIKKNCCQGLTPAEAEKFIYIAEKAGLDPLSKQIYAVKMGSQLSIQTSIDGLRLIAERTGKYAPGEDVEYFYKEEEDSKVLHYAKASVKKQTEDGTWHIVYARAYWNEYAKEASRFWKQFPNLMLAKCAEALALRKSFPNDLSGLYIKEEMDQAANESDQINSDQIEKIKNATQDLNESELNELKKYLKLDLFSDMLKKDYEDNMKFIDRFIDAHSNKE